MKRSLFSASSGDCKFSTLAKPSADNLESEIFLDSEEEEGEEWENDSWQAFPFLLEDDSEDSEDEDEDEDEDDDDENEEGLGSCSTAFMVKSG